jgi:PAS domain S-box-containing protein
MSKVKHPATGIAMPGKSTPDRELLKQLRELNAAHAELQRQHEQLLQENVALKSTTKGKTSVKPAAALNDLTLIWQATFDSIQDAICILDSERRIIKCNQAMLKMFQQKNADIIGKKCWEVVHRTAQPQSGCPVTRMTASLRHETIDLQIGDRWFEVTADPLFDEHNTMIGAVHAVRDITDRKHTQSALIDIQHRQLTLISNLPGFVYRCNNDPQWTMLYMSEGCKKITGYNPSDFIKNRKLAYSDIIHPEHKPHLWQAWQQMLKEKKVYEGEYQIVTASGEVRWVLERGRGIFSDSGEVLYLEGFISDITEINQMRETIRMQHDLLNSCQQLAKIGGWEWDIGRQTMTWTAETYRIHGCKPNDIPAGSAKHITRSLACYAPGDRSIIAAAFEKCCNHGKKYDLEFPFTTMDGEHRWIRTQAEPVLKDGSIVKVIGNIMDITERKRLENVLLGEEANARALMESINDVVILLEKDGTVIDCNEAHAKRLGMTRQELIGKNVYPLLPKDIAKRRRDFIEQVVATGKEVFFEDYSAGIWNDVCVYPVYINGAVSNRVAIFARNITARKMVEEELKRAYSQLTATLESTADGLLVVDKQRKITSYNQKFQEMWQIPDDIIKLKDNEKCLSYVLKFLESPDIFLERVNAIYACDQHDSLDIINFKDGRIVEIYSQPQRVDGEIIGRVWSFRDITGIRRAEEALRESETKLKELNDAKDKFFSIIAHDLKNPFHSIIGFSELLQEQIEQHNYKESAEYAKIIHKSSELAMSLLTNLLEWSRAKTGRMEFNQEHIEIVKLILQEVGLVKNTAAKKAITIHTELPHSATAFADKAMLATILRNLISNAIKFTNPGGEISIAVSQTATELTICVSDNGIGIEPQKMQKLFKIEQNVTTLGTLHEKGTGLGLILCKEFIEQHNSNINVESSPGKGSKFSFTLKKMME